MQFKEVDLQFNHIKELDLYSYDLHDELMNTKYLSYQK